MLVNIVDTQIKELIKQGKLHSSVTDLLDHVQPATLDIPGSSDLYVLENYQTLLTPDANVREIAEDIKVEKISLNPESRQDFRIEKNVKYAMKAIDVDLTEIADDIRIESSAKSRIGRNYFELSTVFDKSDQYDRVGYRKKGELWIEFTCGFNQQFHQTRGLTQLQFIQRHLESPNYELATKELLFVDGKPLFNYDLEENRLPVRVNLVPNELVGYESRIDTNKRVKLDGTNKKEDFWTPIHADENGVIKLKKGHMYILSTYEAMSIPKEYTAQMIPTSHNIGKLTSNTAGLFDPDFGHKGGELKGCSGVLEVITEKDMELKHMQQIALMKFYRNITLPEKGYDGDYQGQLGPQLAKNFV